MTPLEDRYDRLRLIPWWSQDVLRQATVFVAGVGAVGNEVVKNLALMGVGRILILDKDTIELTNLTRSVLFRQEDVGEPKAVVAARRARELDPSIEVIPLVADLAEVGLGVLAGCDLSIGCFDSQYGRILLNRFCARLGIPWIHGALGDGADVFKGVLTVFHAPEGPCFECGLRPGSAEQELSVRLSRGGCGETERLAKEQRAVPSTPTMASIIGALQVQEAAKILHAGLRPEGVEAGRWPEPAWGTFLHYATGAHEVHLLQRPVRKDCPNHAPVTHRSLDGFDATRPFSELWERHGLAPDALVAIHGQIREGATCPQCGHEEEGYRVLSGRVATCSRCEAGPLADTFWYFTADHPITAQSPRGIGLPPGMPLRLLGEPETLLTWPRMTNEVQHGQ